MGIRQANQTILNTLTIVGECSERIGWPKLFVLLASKWREGQANQTILNTLIIVGECSERIGWPKLFVLLANK